MNTRVAILTLAALLLAATAGCRQDMHDQPRYTPLQASSFFGDGRSARPLVEGTIARGQLREDDLLYSGRLDGQLANRLPLPLTRELLDRGRQRYQIFCTPCHGATGNGRGMVVQRGFPPAASFHEQRLRDEPAAYIFDVISNGFGRMQSYAAQVPVADRWAITAYVRALQLSQSAAPDRLSPEDRRLLDESLRAPEPGHGDSQAGTAEAAGGHGGGASR